MRPCHGGWRRTVPALAIGLGLALAGCGNGGDGGGGVDIPTGSHVVLAWNDLGMHCLNPTYDQAVILPPYNTLWVQVIQRGAPPQVVTQGLTVEYSFRNNTSSSGKTDSFGGDYAGFWQYDQDLFGVDLPLDQGLNLNDPGLHNGLAGTMVVDGDHFVVDGVPLVPVDDDGEWNPYQIAEITVKNAQGDVLGATTAVAPTSDEIRCSICHGQGGAATAAIGGGTADPFHNILAIHDLREGQEYSPPLVDQAPVLCASCHASPVLGTPAPSEPGLYLSAAIHGAHAEAGATCYNCHPGQVTQCSRSLAHAGQSDDGNCTTCHGALAQVAGSIVTQGRVPWVDEPACNQASCHQGVQGVATGDVLYRNAAGHGGVRCSGCHGSPHAMIPTAVAADNQPAIQHQGKALSLGSCAVCHASSRGEGSSEFGEEHGGANPEKRTACHLCHTAVPTDTARWPHAFTWHAR